MDDALQAVWAGVGLDSVLSSEVLTAIIRQIRLGVATHQISTLPERFASFSLRITYTQIGVLRNDTGALASALRSDVEGTFIGDELCDGEALGLQFDGTSNLLTAVELACLPSGLLGMMVALQEHATLYESLLPRLTIDALRLQLDASPAPEAFTLGERSGVSAIRVSLQGTEVSATIRYANGSKETFVCGNFTYFADALRGDRYIWSADGHAITTARVAPAPDATLSTLFLAAYHSLLRDRDGYGEFERALSRALSFDVLQERFDLLIFGESHIDRLSTVLVNAVPHDALPTGRIEFRATHIEWMVSTPHRFERGFIYDWRANATDPWWDVAVDIAVHNQNVVMTVLHLNPAGPAWEGHRQQRLRFRRPLGDRSINSDEVERWRRWDVELNRDAASRRRRFAAEELQKENIAPRAAFTDLCV